MAMKPIDKRRPEEKRQAIWDAMRSLGTFTVNDLFYKSRLVKGSIRDYLTGLHKAGYIQIIAKSGHHIPATWQLLRDTGLEAPRVSKDGTEVTQGRSREQMWRTMRILGEFSGRDLAVHASTETCQVNEREAKSYSSFLYKAGYLAISRKGHGTGSGGVLTRYRFIAKRFTGPKPPMIQRIKAVFDPNTNKVVWDSLEGRHDN